MSTQALNDQIAPILFVIGHPDNWGLYIPQLLDLARARGAGIHVLETGGPLGTGSFTSNAVHLQDQPSLPIESKDPSSTDTPGVPDEAPAPADTIRAGAQTTAFLEELLAYFQDAGITAQGDWQPDYDRAQLGPYARKIGAQTIAVIDHGFPANVLQSAYIATLEDEGFEVVRLREISADELEQLRERAGTAQP